MYTLSKLTWASIKMFVRNRQALYFTIFFPILIMVIFGVIGFDRTPTINIGVTVQGNITPQAQAYINQLRTIKVFKVFVGTESTERKALENGNRSLVLLTHQMASQSETGPHTLTILRNAGDAQAQTAISVISQIFDKQTIAQAHITPAVTLDVQEVNSHNLKYIDFLLPGLLAMSIMQLSVFSVAFVFVDYKEKGILKRIIATPVKPYQFVVANIITRLIVSIVQAALFIILGVLLFQVQIIGSYWLILLLVIIGSIMFLGLGFTVSGLAKTTDAVPAIANLIVFPMLFLGGVFFSIENMPNWLQSIAHVLPLTYFSTGLRDVMNKGAGFTNVLPNIMIMLIWAVVLVALAILTFRFEEKRNK
jgi:ABC-2 type transport system permease protein